MRDYSRGLPDRYLQGVCDAQLEKRGSPIRGRHRAAFRLSSDFGSEAAAAMESVLIVVSDDRTGPAGPRAEGIPQIYSLGSRGPKTGNRPGNVFGFMFPYFPPFVKGFGAARRSLARRNNLQPIKNKMRAKPKAKRISPGNATGI